MTKLDESEESRKDAVANSLQRLAEVAEQVGSTTKKLEKAALVGNYLKQLDDPDLGRAARYFAGHQFAQNDARTTNVGGSIISTALSAATGFSQQELAPIYVRLGDAGEAAHEAVREAKRFNLPTISLAQTESIISRLSETRGTNNKTALLAAVLNHATPLEAKYLVKLLAGDLRIGLREGLVEDAIARAFERPLAVVAQVNMLLGDVGETAVRARANDLQDVKMRLFHPIKFMLATPATDLADIARTMAGDFFVEDKFDGIRAQAHIQDGRVAITRAPWMRSHIVSRNLFHHLKTWAVMPSSMGKLCPPAASESWRSANYKSAWEERLLGKTCWLRFL